MNSSERLQHLFERYLQRQCDPAEVAELMVLLDRADAAETLTPAMRRLWEQLKTSPAEYPVDWDRMYNRISHVEEGLSILSPAWKWRRIGKRVAVAAGVVLLAGCVGWWMAKENSARTPGAALVQRGGAAAVVAPTALAAEAKDARRVVHLPDGSTVLLNKNSRLDYPQVLSGTAREVTLTGEAYFDITHMSSRPFLVHTGKLTTRVMGTCFNIRAYPGDKAIAITVTSGRVQVLKQGSSLGLLSENQQIRYDIRSDSLLRQEKIDVKPLVAWKPEEVNFDDITMEEAARRIHEWFGVNVEFVHPGVKGCRVTATFYKEDDLEEIMTVICQVNQSTFTIHEKNVLIDGGGCK